LKALLINASPARQALAWKLWVSLIQLPEVDQERLWGNIGWVMSQRLEIWDIFI